MKTTSTGAPSAHPSPTPVPPPTYLPFSLDGWLESFRTVGGGYVIANGHVHLFVATTGAPAREVRMAREMLARLPDWELRLVNEAVIRASLGEWRA